MLARAEQGVATLLQSEQKTLGAVPHELVDLSEAKLAAAVSVEDLLDRAVRGEELASDRDQPGIDGVHAAIIDLRTGTRVLPCAAAAEAAMGER